jgi:hypothetical protein
MRRNDELGFDDRIRTALGGYVYALRDPTNKEVFYIGKAGGWDAQGNDRVLAHFFGARACQDDPQRKRSEKVERIIKIWDSGHDVDWFVIRRKLQSEAEAFHVEAALIDLLEISSAPDAINDIKGIRGGEHGLLDSTGVRLLAAPKLGAGDVPSELAGRPILIFNIQRAIAEQKTPDAYAATRRSWKLGPGARMTDKTIAVGLSSGISRGAWEIESWARDADDPKRWCFTGRDLPPELLSHIVPRNFHAVVAHDSVRGYWQRGNPISIELSENGQFRVIRGSSDREWHNCVAAS